MEDIHVTHWGEDGVPVVMIHGGVQGSGAAGERNFGVQKPLADEGWRLIVPDRPGHGQSPYPGRGDDAQLDGIWVADLLGDGAHLVGHSFGGLVALSAAARRPEAVRSLTLIEPALHKIATHTPAVRKFGLRMLIAQIFSFSAETRARRLMALLGIPIRDFGRSKTELANMGKAMRRATFPPTALMLSELAAVKAAGIPFLVISGGWSDAFVATGDVAAAGGGGRHVIAPSEHHFPQWNGESFNDLLATFWREADADGSTVSPAAL